MSIIVIGEVGINHNGDMEICKQLIDVAKDAGADCVNFRNEISIKFTLKIFQNLQEKAHGAQPKESKKKAQNLASVIMKGYGLDTV